MQLDVQLDAEQFHFDAATRTFNQDISMLQMGGLPLKLALANVPPDGKTHTFVCVGADRHGEDVAGWHYREVGHSTEPLKILIIND